MLVGHPTTGKGSGSQVRCEHPNHLIILSVPQALGVVSNFEQTWHHCAPSLEFAYPLARPQHVKRLLQHTTVIKEYKRSPLS